MQFLLKTITLGILLSMLSCREEKEEKKPQSLGDQIVTIFDSTDLYFDPAFKENPDQIGDSILRLDAGRVLLKKVTLPTYELQPSIRIDVTLTSNGDPWDKSGSLFVIPKDADLSILSFEDSTYDLSEQGAYPAVKPFIADSLRYLPSIELLRFMTPFGIGYFNEDERIKDRKPIYIPEWEENVHWNQDITPLLSYLEGEVYIGVFIDTWTKDGYNLTAALHYDESTISNHTKKETGVIPLVNTSKYASSQVLYDNFHQTTLSVDFKIDSTMKNVQLHYITTGHGGHSEGDEFNKKENILYLDNEPLFQFIPWRDDCASFRRFNPTSGVWEEPITWDGEETTERIASSDYSRSNWCPGSDVIPEVIDLKHISNGRHTLKISIPEAQKLLENEMNYWMVSAYLTYDIHSTIENK